MSEKQLTADKLTAAYMKLRSVIREKEDKHKQEIAELKEQFDIIADKLLEICEEQGADSIRTPAGTITRQVTSRYWTSDWDSMYKFMKKNDALHLLEQRIHNGNMKQFLDDYPDKCPMGLQADRRYTVSVRKPTSK